MNLTTKRQRFHAKQAMKKAIKRLEAAIIAVDSDSDHPAYEELHDASDAVSKAINHMIVPVSAYSAYLAKNPV
jgi:hypothetical protein